MPSDKKQVNAIGSLPDFLNCPESDKKVKPSNPEIVSKGKEIQYTAPIQSQVPKSEYIVNICKVTSIFCVQNLQTYLQVESTASDKMQDYEMADLSDTLGPSGSGKEVKPSIPDPIPSQVLKSEYIEDISKVTSIFYAQNFYA